MQLFLISGTASPGIRSEVMSCWGINVLDTQNLHSAPELSRRPNMLFLDVCFLGRRSCCASKDGYDPKRSRVSDDKLAEFIRSAITGKVTEVRRKGRHSWKAEGASFPMQIFLCLGPCGMLVHTDAHYKSFRREYSRHDFEM